MGYWTTNRVPCLLFECTPGATIRVAITYPARNRPRRFRQQGDCCSHPDPVPSHRTVGSIVVAPAMGPKTSAVQRRDEHEREENEDGTVRGRGCPAADRI